MPQKAVLQVNNLKTSFFTEDGEVPAVDGISFTIHEGEILGIVGESGCGKSVTSLSIMKLIPSPPGKIVEGEIYFNEQNLVPASEEKMRQIRGNEMAMIFQEPMTSLNPLFTIGNQLTEPLRIHKKLTKKQAKEHIINVLKLVGLPRAEELINEYPHQLSGGMRQRVMIAMALLCDPKLLIADEPTTALDVTIQAQILQLMKSLNKKLNTAVMLITHDLGVVAEVCDRIVVMYGGQIVEEADVKTIFKNAKHPYTMGLIKSIPDKRFKKDRLYSIPGNVPKPGSVRTGCRFAARCEFAFERCTKEDPYLYGVSAEGEKPHYARCFLHETEGVKKGDTAVTSS
ncbi:ABC transporter ATP-binding protein [Priestia koreensis]|uniref:ABC transporter ATP-binding protein n=1 Tax=Priestia koreensis TaxID=284581 RepID=UPI001F55D123|nr:ABC transporter ATP-binding protein [Priestia koreensis]MCM3006994.1 ABC transporter ATP-binding protein [Priestia koreensis]UNL85454.1 ABC transporter ATP-binding protein [Priestia koreensis]